MFRFHQQSIACAPWHGIRETDDTGQTELLEPPMTLGHEVTFTVPGDFVEQDQSSRSLIWSLGSAGSSETAMLCACSTCLGVLPL